MGDRRHTTPICNHAATHAGQLGLLPSALREMSTGQSAVMRSGRRVKAGWLITFVDKRVGGR